MAVRIPIVADVSDWLRGTRKISGSLEDAGDDLKKLARDSERSTENVERDFEEMARAADSAFDKMRRDADKAGRSIDGDLRDATSTTGEIAAEAGQEFTQNWSEAVSSGDVGGAVTDTFANLGNILAVAGPAGAVAGIGITAAATFVRGFREKAEEQRQIITDAVSGLFDGISDQAAELSGKEAADAWNRGFLEAREIPERIAELLETDVITAWEQVSQAAEGHANLTRTDVQNAILGNQDALGEVGTAIDANNALIRDYEYIQDTIGANNRDIYDQEQEKIDRLRDQNGILSNVLTKGRGFAEESERGARAQRELEVQLRYASAQADALAGNAQAAADALARSKEEARLIKQAIDVIPSQTIAKVGIDVIVTETRKDAALAARGTQQGRYP